MLTTIEQLETIYGEPNERSLRKEIPYVNEDYRTFIELAPFVVLATAGPEGLDCSPRGDAPGFVRIDSLRNIIVEPHLALLFIVPGVGETLRVNGRGRISNDAALLESFAVDGKLPRTVLLVDVDAVYFHCSKALARSRLWDPARHVERSRLPSTGSILKRLSGESFDAVKYDLELVERLRTGLY
jgi:predicted pyridoxine 5'-phosphate oxidase superfamily flavin-nucleotide-binding protein